MNHAHCAMNERRPPYPVKAQVMNERANQPVMRASRRNSEKPDNPHSSKVTAPNTAPPSRRDRRCFGCSTEGEVQEPQPAPAASIILNAVNPRNATAGSENSQWRSASNENTSASDRKQEE